MRRKNETSSVSRLLASIAVGPTKKSPRKDREPLVRNGKTYSIPAARTNKKRAQQMNKDAKSAAVWNRYRKWFLKLDTED